MYWVFINTDEQYKTARVFGADERNADLVGAEIDEVTRSDHRWCMSGGKRYGWTATKNILAWVVTFDSADSCNAFRRRLGLCRLPRESTEIGEWMSRAIAAERERDELSAKLRSITGVTEDGAL